MSRHLHRCNLRFSRTMGEAFRTPEWSDPIERPAPRNPLARWGWVALALVVFYLMVKA